MDNMKTLQLLMEDFDYYDFDEFSTDLNYNNADLTMEGDSEWNH